MKKLLVLFLIVSFYLVPSMSFALNVDYRVGVDDFVELYINNNLIISYDAGPSADVDGSANLSQGWYDISIVYKNRWGSNKLWLNQDYTSTGSYSTIPLEYYRSLDQSGNYINGLRADYYDLSGGFITTIYGEGPIAHAWAPYPPGVYYEGQLGLWAGIFGGDYPSGNFEERLSGQIYIGSSVPPAVPEPATMLLLGSGLIGLAGYGRKKFKK
jgi:hypothetical protein